VQSARREDLSEMRHRRRWGAQDEPDFGLPREDVGHRSQLERARRERVGVVSGHADEDGRGGGQARRERA
jgi:hypothetical protein